MTAARQLFGYCSKMDSLSKEYMLTDETWLLLLKFDNLASKTSSAPEVTTTVLSRRKVY